MESIYYVICWACRRQCDHCYDDRFRPHTDGELTAWLDEAETRFPAIIDHFPEQMTFQDLDSESDALQIGRIILAGGEVLIPEVRARLLLPILDRLHQKYQGNGGVRLVIQTTGDLIDEAVLDRLLEHHAWEVSVAGMDDFHKGMEGESGLRLKERLIDLFESRGMTAAGLKVDDGVPNEDGPFYSFFGATPDLWIGKLWPRGRAWANEITTAGYGDNFCNQWSGGLGFLNMGLAGSEVAIDPNGDLFPCCMKTAEPYGSLAREPMADILKSLAGRPEFEAIAMGRPERMGITHGWSVRAFYEKSEAVLPSGRRIRNRCLGCDAFHREIAGTILERIRRQRMNGR